MHSKSIDRQLEYWDSRGPTKTFNHPVDFKSLEHLLSHDSAILDYGCGYGRISNDLYNHGYTNVRGIDFSAEMICKGHCLYPHLRLDVVDALPLSFPNAEFDAVFLFTVLTCIPSSEAQISLIQELHRVLKNGGLLYISDLCLHSDERNQRRYQRFQERYGVYGIFELPEGAVLRHHDLQWIKTLTADFREASLKQFDVITMNNNAARGFQLLAHK